MHRGLLVLAALLVAVSASLTQSQLTCTPKEAEPGANITCYIYVRDALQEPTSRFETNSFVVKLLTDIADVRATVSPLERTIDPTIAKFNVNSNEGTNIRIDVEVAGTGRYIQNSGFVATVLTWPPKRLGTLTCNSSTLQLRETVSCSAPAFGANNVPAIVRVNDIYFSEDHSEGSFKYISGKKELVFEFTAPNFPSMVFNNFALRVTLSGSTSVYSTKLPLVIPSLKSTERSVLKCAGESTEMCFVNAADSIGPVQFNPDQFIVRVEEHDTEQNMWFDVTNQINVQWIPIEGNQGSRKLSFQPKVNNKVFNARLFVECKGCGKENEQLSVIGSPFVFRSGSPPTAQFVSFRRCDLVFMSGLNTTKCILDFASTVTPDPRYITVTSSKGGEIGALKFYNSSSVPSGLSFKYTAPNVKERTTIYLTVRVGMQQIVRSPYKLVVYSRKSFAGAEFEMENTRPAKIAIGLLFFGAILVTGGVLFCRRQQRISRIRVRHAKKMAELEMEDLAAEEEESKKQQQSAATGDDNDNDSAPPPMSLGAVATPREPEQ